MIFDNIYYWPKPIWLKDLNISMGRYGTWPVEECSYSNSQLWREINITSILLSYSWSTEALDLYTAVSADGIIISPKCHLFPNLRNTWCDCSRFSEKGILSPGMKESSPLISCIYITYGCSWYQSDWMKCGGFKAQNSPNTYLPAAKYWTTKSCIYIDFEFLPSTVGLIMLKRELR